MASITLKGDSINTIADLPAIGTQASDFQLVDADLNNVSLADFKGKKKLLNIVPSLDTPVCAISTQKFNQYATEHDNVAILVISADLPFAQSRFCSAENTDNVRTLSMMRSRDFAKNYGVLIVDGPLQGICARAVVVLDENNQVIHTELVPEIAQEPDYQQALQALK